MIEVRLVVPASVEQVFAVLADGWSYAGWVVGAAHIREVDAGWPGTGTRIHHSVGAWPVAVQDVTTVLDVDPPRMLELEARLWPLGAARIRFTLAPASEGCEITMAEEAIKGPLSLLPTPAQSLFLIPRNRESLTRLAAQSTRKHTP
ncbi:polyketide cyclase/dehydrase/lipid transport protein [Saccharothrix carnea]|uniref:Polyketide cyclase/dehydrase/lipid transport protein n=1 Tax=Saccharothrix carnea TaxID=1280637 RepID=A0A2P8I5L9_SACCR|nr:SRPBCC family protein [Saccharothrix carnea]PSL53746.1 polyketide cyclase/dehydrase/lipid transport protein [Saccharothrix carnea]